MQRIKKTFSFHWIKKAKTMGVILYFVVTTEFLIKGRVSPHLNLFKSKTKWINIQQLLEDSSLYDIHVLMVCESSVSKIRWKHELYKGILFFSIFHTWNGARLRTICYRIRSCRIIPWIDRQFQCLLRWRSDCSVFISVMFFSPQKWP